MKISIKPITMQNQEKIIQAIAATLEENLNHAHIGYEIDCQEIAAEITAAIAPHLEAVADLPYSELFDHMVNEHGLTLTNTELGDIIHVARGTGTKSGWEDAPSWAEFRTTTNSGDIIYWERQPVCSGYGCKTERRG